MLVPFLSRSGHKRLGERLLRTTMNLGRTWPKNGGGGVLAYAVGVYSALCSSSPKVFVPLLRQCGNQGFCAIHMTKLSKVYESLKCFTIL